MLALALWALVGSCATYENVPQDAVGAPSEAGTDAGGSPAGGGGSGSGGAPISGATGAGMAGQTTNLGGASGAASGGSRAGSSGGGVSGTGGGGGSSGGSSGSGGGPNGGSGGVSGGGGKANGGGAGKASAGADTGGTGGSPATQTCAGHPIPVKSKWLVTASAADNGAPAGNAADGMLTTRWTTGKEQMGAEWLQVDFGALVTLTKLTLALGTSANDYPRKYMTRFSNASMNVGAPVLVSGMGAAATDTVMSFPAGTSARYLLISQGGSAPGLWWSVAEIQAECAD